MQTNTQRHSRGCHQQMVGRIRVPLALLAALLLLLSWVPTADAGTYTVWYCRTAANPGIDGLPDWSSSRYGVGYPFPPVITCQAGPQGQAGQVTVQVIGDAGNNADLVVDDLQVLAPPRVRLDRISLWWRGGAQPHGQVAVIAIVNGAPSRMLADYRDAVFGPDVGYVPEQPATYELGAGAQGLVVRAACLNTCTVGNTLIADYTVSKAALSASDSSAPQGEASGSLLTDVALSGQPSVTIDATDTGAGLHHARILADGQVRASSEFGDRLCRDVDPDNQDPYEFSTVSPCPLRGAVTLPLDTAGLTDDAYHLIQVQVVDASGNATTVAERTVGVDNLALPAGYFDASARRFLNPLFSLAAPRQLNGSGATSGARLRVYLPVSRDVRVRGRRRRMTRGRSSRTLRFASRATLRGVLTDPAGRPITGAKVWLASRVEGQEWQITGPPLTTSKTGRIGLHLPGRAPSREINLVYFPHSDSHEQAVGRPVRLKVRAGARLWINRRSVRNRQRVRFGGRVEGPISERGITASLQAKVGRRYRTFRQVRITRASGGRFSTSYRFTATTRTTRYRFRLMILKQAGLPYESGTSPVRTVLVRAG